MRQTMAVQAVRHNNHYIVSHWPMLRALSIHNNDSRTINHLSRCVEMFECFVTFVFINCRRMCRTQRAVLHHRWVVISAWTADLMRMRRTIYCKRSRSYRAINHRYPHRRILRMCHRKVLPSCTTTRHMHRCASCYLIVIIICLQSSSGIAPSLYNARQHLERIPSTSFGSQLHNAPASIDGEECCYCSHALLLSDLGTVSPMSIDYGRMHADTLALLDARMCFISLTL